ncbi:MAG: class I SAM-dependent methyltransferase [Syntrophobacterales bacterium]|nr:class I SAM-dependent methyltransferase [Syntrophobacterales bacterium]
MTFACDTCCKICGEKSFLLDTVDFHKSCDPRFNEKEPLAGIPVYYYGCPFCGFVFTTYCDSWTPEEFMGNIYNNRYAECDPDFIEKRPMLSALWFERQFLPHKELKVLDFGSGQGLFGTYLNARGFDVTSYDPFYGDDKPPLRESFDLVIAIEVLEHSHTPLQTIGECFSFLKKDGPACFIATTLLTTVPMEKLKHNLSAYWYAGPRNGHISLFTEKAMRLIAEKNGALYAGNGQPGFFFFRGFEKKLQRPQPGREVK